jgi:hypothetical protein
MCPNTPQGYVVFTSTLEPLLSLHDALFREDALKWQKAIQDELAFFINK